MPIIIMQSAPPDRLDRREVARLIIDARHAEMARIHAERDQCLAHALEAAIIGGHARHHLPRRIRARAHERIDMPAARMFAKMQEAGA